jgi:N-acetyl-anhydromuramyl-L-alanine amidase AmpD
MRTIKRIFVHCTASHQNNTTVESLKREFKNKGWKNPGYHYVIFPDGKVVNMLSEDLVSNGVQGYNSTAINVAYVGGIDSKGKAVDNRTEEQKKTLIAVLNVLKLNYPKAIILGHRDISPDKNGNGVVDPWERIKECPCFNAKEEYKNL